MLIHHVHQDQFALYLPPMAARLGRWLESKGSCLVYRDRTIIAVSPSTRMGARRRLGLKGDIVVIPPGFESPAATLAPLKSRSKTPRIVCVGRLVAHKSVASIVAAVPELVGEFPGLELHIVGDGTERPAIEAIVSDLDLSDHVVVHGALSTPDRDQLMRTAWMSVNASKGEGWGLSVVEANSLGVPVLAYQRPGLRDSIRHGETGWLLDDAEALARPSPLSSEIWKMRARPWQWGRERASGPLSSPGRRWGHRSSACSRPSGAAWPSHRTTGAM